MCCASLELMRMEMESPLIVMLLCNFVVLSKGDGIKNDCTLGKPSQSPHTHMAERVTVSCDVHQHNVTLTLNSTLDSGSVWFCENNTVSNIGQVTRATSVKLIINVTTTSMSTYGSSTPTSTFLTSNSDNSRPDIQNRHSVKEDRPVIENGNLNTAFQHDSTDDDIMVENDLYERSADVISPATQDPGKADDRQVEGSTVKEGPPDIWNGNSNATLQHDSIASDDDIMVENHLYERSSDVISQATRDLGNTDGVTDGKVNKVQEKTTQPDPVPVTAIPDSGDARPI